jgi:hypothetical protein
LIVTTVVVIQPVESVYDIVVVPAVNPDTTPVEGSIDPTAVVLLAHVPPVVASASVVTWPIHALGVPVIADSGYVVMVNVVRHPVPTV